LIATPSGPVAAVHAGWRGLAAGVLAASIEALGRIAPDTDAAVAVIGPHIGATCYEVDAPVVRALRMRFGGDVDAALRSTRPGHFEIELAQLAALDLARAGLARERIAVLADACTACDPRRFHSYRRNGPASGRLFHYIEVIDPVRQSS
jgi:copper oxidase (laccase) domain-containing protein